MNPIIIKTAQIVSPLRVEIAWKTGETFTADLTDWTSPPFDALLDPLFFVQMAVDEWGHGIGWPGGLDLGADSLYELCRKQAGLPTASDFDTWMKRNGLSLTSAAETLGMTRRMITHYRTGSRPIPKVVGLACRGVEISAHQGNR